MAPADIHMSDPFVHSVEKMNGTIEDCVPGLGRGRRLVCPFIHPSIHPFPIRIPRGEFAARGGSQSSVASGESGDWRWGKIEMEGEGRGALSLLAIVVLLFMHRRYGLLLIPSAIHSSISQNRWDSIARRVGTHRMCQSPPPSRFPMPITP